MKTKLPSSFPYSASASWTPASRRDIAGKENLYCTARVAKTGEVIGLTGFCDATQSFNSYGRAFHWTELDSFCL